MRRLLLAAIVLAMMFCQRGNAQSFEVKHKWMMVAQGGLAIPLGDFADTDTTNASAGAANLGPSAGIAIEYGITEQFLIGGRTAYSRFSVDEDALRGADARWTVLEILGVYGKYLVNTGARTRPYGRAGVFIAKPNLDVSDNAQAWSGEFDPSIGIELALGVGHQIATKWAIGLEARFANVFVSESEADNSAAAMFGSTRLAAPHGVRDPGGNLDWLAVSGYLAYGL